MSQMRIRGCNKKNVHDRFGEIRVRNMFVDFVRSNLRLMEAARSALHDKKRGPVFRPFVL